MLTGDWINDFSGLESAHGQRERRLVLLSAAGLVGKSRGYVSGLAT